MLNIRNVLTKDKFFTGMVLKSDSEIDFYFQTFALSASYPRRGRYIALYVPLKFPDKSQVLPQILTPFVRSLNGSLQIAL